MPQLSAKNLKEIVFKLTIIRLSIEKYADKDLAIYLENTSVDILNLLGEKTRKRYTTNEAGQAVWRLLRRHKKSRR